MPASSSKLPTYTPPDREVYLVHSNRWLTAVPADTHVYLQLRSAREKMDQIAETPRLVPYYLFGIIIPRNGYLYSSLAPGRGWALRYLATNVHLLTETELLLRAIEERLMKGSE